MTIRFFCTCSQPLAAPDQYAGQTVRCTACNELQVVPVAASPNGFAPVWNPAAEDFDGTPPRGGAGGWRKRLGLAASAVLLLAGGAGLWWLFFRGDPASSSEYDLVPRDALAFFTVKVSEVLKTAEGARALRLMRQLPESDLNAREQELGLKLEEIDRLTVVTLDFEQTTWVILRTVRDCDPARILAASDFAQESMRNGRQYHINREGVGLLFIDNRTLVIGPEPGIQRCIDLPRKRMQGPLTEAIRLASRNEHHAVAGVNGPRLAARLKAEDGRTGKALKAVGLLEADTLTATASLAGKVNVEVRVDFPTAEQASQVVAALPLQTLLARGLFIGMTPMPGELFMGVDAQRLKMLAVKCLSQLAPKQDGARVRFQLGIETKDLLEVFGVADRGAPE